MGTTRNQQPSEKQPHSGPSGDLAWLAFRYVAEELSADEAEAFELQLADDQAAREAVAQAVELSAAVKVALGDSVESAPAPLLVARGFWSQKTWLQPAAWMAIGAAACLAAVVCFYQPGPDENRPAVALNEGLGAKPAASSDSLAIFWAEARDSDSDDPMATAAEEHADAEHADAEHGFGSDDPKVIAPGWLLAAVTRGEMTDDLHLSSDDE